MPRLVTISSTYNSIYNSIYALCRRAPLHVRGYIFIRSIILAEIVERIYYKLIYSIRFKLINLELSLINAKFILITSRFSLINLKSKLRSSLKYYQRTT